MCLILFAFRVHPLYPLIVAANRDEFLERPTAAASYWSDEQEILAGRDLLAGGTWLGITRSGRFAAITNHRDLRRGRPSQPLSRGSLVLSALKGEPDLKSADRYDGFNLLFGSALGLRYSNNIDGSLSDVTPGIHGLSNHLLNTPWPKVLKAKSGFRAAIAAEQPEPEALFNVLLDRSIAPDEQLPDTGIGIERERALSPAFISTTGYGTRCSTVVMFGADGRIRFEERTHEPVGMVEYIVETKA
ncbi:MAG: NRDE family protein [Flavobacteriales bacterium]|nr:NRDE family protein [Flavobacteriales bacterium]